MAKTSFPNRIVYVHPEFYSLMTPAQFAELHRVTHQTIMRYINAGMIEVIQIGANEKNIFIDAPKWAHLSFTGNRNKKRFAEEE